MINVLNLSTEDTFKMYEWCNEQTKINQDYQFYMQKLQDPGNEIDDDDDDDDDDDNVK